MAILVKPPYVRYLCPCTQIKPKLFKIDDFDVEEEETENEQVNEEQQDTLDPHSKRAYYNLYPLEGLTFCNECYEIRCPRCYYEEALQYYCPSCLFESQSTIVKSETNRCTRSCFQCPICVASLQISGYQNPDEPRPEPQDTTARDGPCILSCPSCCWTSLEMGIVFEKPVNLSGQLAKIQPSALFDRNSQNSESNIDVEPSKVESGQYNLLASFYKTQITETTPSGPFGLNHNFGLDSPNQLSRLLSTYGLPGLKKQREKLPVMREALSTSEGLRTETAFSTDEHIISQMQIVGWDGTTSIEQRNRQSNNTRFVSDLRPISTKLRSRRAKRCRACRYNLVKPEEKRGKYRHQIKLVALNFIPTITVRPLDTATTLQALIPSKTIQLLLTFRNPLFDSVKVTLATSRITPGKVASKVTILCPQFEVGANTDVWDDALDTTAVERRKAREALEGIQPEAGKIWDKGRNWTSIVVELVVGHPPTSPEVDLQVPSGNREPVSEENSPKFYDIEIPLSVRLEHETDDTGGDTLGEDSTSANAKERKVKRELAYWCVIGAGRIRGA